MIEGEAVGPSAEFDSRTNRSDAHGPSLTASTHIVM